MFYVELNARGWRSVIELNSMKLKEFFLLFKNLIEIPFLSL